MHINIPDDDVDSLILLAMLGASAFRRMYPLVPESKVAVKVVDRLIYAASVAGVPLTLPDEYGGNQCQTNIPE